MMIGWGRDDKTNPFPNSKDQSGDALVEIIPFSQCTKDKRVCWDNKCVTVLISFPWFQSVSKLDYWLNYWKCVVLFCHGVLYSWLQSFFSSLCVMLPDCQAKSNTKREKPHTVVHRWRCTWHWTYKCKLYGEQFAASVLQCFFCFPKALFIGRQQLRCNVQS